MRQRCTGPLVYTIKPGVLFCFVCDAGHAFRDRRLERGVRGVQREPLAGRGARRQFRGVPGTEHGDTEFQNIYEPGNGREMEKMAKIREILEKSHDFNPAIFLLFGAAVDLFKIETLAKMHYQFFLFFLFCSCLTILLILLLLEEMHAATLHRTTRGNNNIQVLKGA